MISCLAAFFSLSGGDGYDFLHQFSLGQFGGVGMGYREREIGVNFPEREIKKTGGPDKDDCKRMQPVSKIYYWNSGFIGILCTDNS